MITLKDVNWGIEIECVGQTRETVARAIQSVVGGEVVHVGTPTVYDPWEVCEAGTNRVWKVVADSSLSNVPADLRTEVVSPILGYADIPVLQEIVRAVHKAGSRCDERCGIHLHLSRPDVTPKALANLAKMVYKQECAR